MTVIEKGRSTCRWLDSEIEAELNNEDNQWSRMRRDDGGDFACCIRGRLSCTACLEILYPPTPWYDTTNQLEAAQGTVHIKYRALCAEVHVYQRELNPRQRNRLRWCLQRWILGQWNRRREVREEKGTLGFEYMGEGYGGY